ncbi:MAG TPA: DUF418 domain-containing protein [Alcaligenes sp.]|nr:DUF418 domain-containing protein [Alcaligenes sp.]
MTSVSCSPERQDFLDCLRGLALLGILLVNIVVFASPYYGSGLPNPLSTTLLDKLCALLVQTFVETKFYLLFSFLFGYSFSLQILSAQRNGQPFARTFMRRLLGLLILGVLHATLLYTADILITYSLAGLLLLLLRHRSDRFLAWLAAGLIATTAALWTYLIFGIDDGPFDPAKAHAELAQHILQYQGGWRDILAENIDMLKHSWSSLVMMQGPCALAMFCLGLIAGRRRLFQDRHANAVLRQRMRLWGLMVGLPSGLFYGYATTFLIGTQTEGVALILTILTAPLLMGLYCTLAWSSYQGKARATMQFLLAPAGRMALSNYLLQSLSCVLIFYGVGLGLVGQLSPSAILAVAMSLYLSQCLLSRLWLRRFQYGPVEWLLRSFTYWRRPPMQQPA